MKKKIKAAKREFKDIQRSFTTGAWRNGIGGKYDDYPQERQENNINVRESEDVLSSLRNLFGTIHIQSLQHIEALPLNQEEYNTYRSNIFQNCKTLKATVLGLSNRRNFSLDTLDKALFIRYLIKDPNFYQTIHTQESLNHLITGALICTFQPIPTQQSPGSNGNEEMQNTAATLGKHTKRVTIAPSTLNGSYHQL